MQTKLFLIVALAVSACGPAKQSLEKVDVELYTGCKLKEVYAGFKTYPGEVIVRFEIARAVMVDAGVFKDAEEFCTALQDMRIEIWDSAVLWPGAIGYYSIFDGIKLNREMVSLVHETFHLMNANKCQPGTIWHEGWDKPHPEYGNQSYYNISDAYKVEINGRLDIGLHTDGYY